MVRLCTYCRSGRNDVPFTINNVLFTALGRQMSGFEPSLPCFCAFFRFFSVFFLGGWGRLTIAAGPILVSISHPKYTCFWFFSKLPNVWRTFYLAASQARKFPEKSRWPPSYIKYVVPGSTYVGNSRATVGPALQWYKYLVYIWYLRYLEERGAFLSMEKLHL